MRPRDVFSGAALALSWMALVLAPAGTAAQEPDTQALDLISSGHVSGLFLEGQLSFVTAEGLRRQDTNEALSANDLFACPALTEVLIAVTVRALDAADQLDAHAPLNTLVAGVGENLGRVTLDQLLTHTAGLDDREVPADLDWSRILEEYPADGFVAEPGTLPSLSRYSYPVVAAVLERLTHSPVEQLVKTLVLTPLGMNRTTFDLGLARSDLATGYRPSMSGNPIEVAPQTQHNGLPVVFTTAPDVIQFAAAWMGGAMREVTPLTAIGGAVPAAGEPRRFADGVWVQSYQGAPSAYIATTALGFGVVIRMFPESATVLVAWSNGLPPWQTVSNLEALVAASLGLSQPAPAPLVESEVLVPAEWAGVYQNGAQQVELKDDGTQLLLHDGSQDRPLVSVGRGMLGLVPPGGGRAAPALRTYVAGGDRFIVMAERAYRRQAGG